MQYIIVDVFLNNYIVQTNSEYLHILNILYKLKVNIYTYYHTTYPHNLNIIVVY